MKNTRITMDTTLERDIDLLIIEEFISDKSFADMILTPFEIGDSYTIEQAIHSKTDADLGESDIVFILNIDGKKHAIHIEDKIDAQAMPEQHDRYAKRIEKDIAAGEYDSGSWMLIAPEKYLVNNSEAKKYEYQVTYEQLRDFFAEQQGLRAQYKKVLINRAIVDQKSGYQLHIHPAVKEFCSKMNAHQKKTNPGLPTGTIAWWPHRKVPLKGAYLVYKPNVGYCDLTFSGVKSEELTRRTYGYLSDRMFIASTGKSSSVRIRVTAFSLQNVYETKTQEVDEALQALQELYDLAVRIAAS